MLSVVFGIFAAGVCSAKQDGFTCSSLKAKSEGVLFASQERLFGGSQMEPDTMAPHLLEKILFFHLSCIQERVHAFCLAINFE